MGASGRPHREIRGRRTAAWLLPLAVFVALLAFGVPAAGALIPGITVTGSGPGVVKVDGVEFSGEGGVWLYQCSDTPTSEEDFWSFCDQSTALQVTHDPPWSVDFTTKNVITSGEEGFPPGTENWIGNHTYDCEAAGSTCWVVATEDRQSFTWAEIPFVKKYGPLAKATVTVTPPSSWTSLTDGQLVTVHDAGHRPGTQAMAYACEGYGKAFPGGCDPIPASELTIPGTGVYHNAAVPLPRFVWVDPPPGYGDGSWYDCANGCSVVVASADNLASPYWVKGVDALLKARAEPLEKHPAALTVTSVQVSKLGGITIAGTIDCTQAIAQWGQSAFQAGVFVSWRARQPIDRMNAVTAHYDAVMASLCHDPLDTDASTPPYPWATYPPITDPVIWWVYPDVGGMFKAGSIHLDVQVTGAPWSTSPGASQYILTGVTQWDGKAVAQPAEPKDKGGKGKGKGK
jgi:hypothetical protein